VTTTEYLAKCKENREAQIAARVRQPRVRSYADEAWRDGLKEISSEDRESN
jgi:hypothetical protein